MFTTDNSLKSWIQLTVCTVQQLSADSKQCAEWFNPEHTVLQTVTTNSMQYYQQSQNASNDSITFTSRQVVSK